MFIQFVFSFCFVRFFLWPFLPEDFLLDVKKKVNNKIVLVHI